MLGSWGAGARTEALDPTPPRSLEPRLSSASFWGTAGAAAPASGLPRVGLLVTAVSPS